MYTSCEPQDIMPPRQRPPPGAPAAPSRRPAAATNAAAPAADELSNAMASMNAPSFRDYGFDVRHPFMVKQTPFIQGSKIVIVDLYVYSLDQGMYIVSLDASGTKLSIVTVVPPMFSDPNRLAQEYALEGDRDALLTSHVETTNVIRRDHPNGVHYSPPQVITLPFACEQEFQKGMIWNEGSVELFQFFERTGTPSPHQYSSVLRITLRSVQKAITEYWNQPTVTQGCHNPPGGGAGGGGGGGGGGGASVSISTTPPTSPTEGDLWYSSILGRTFIYYTDEDSSQWVDAAPFNPVEPPSTPGKTSSSFTATEGQTIFSVSYTVGYIDVFLNGARLNSSEYIASNGSSITLLEGATADDVLDVVEFRMGIGATGPTGSGGPLNNITVSTSSSTHYPLFTLGAGSTTPFITTTNDYFEFTPSSGTLNVNQLVVSGVTTSTDFNATSDINLKENINVINNPIEKLVGISGVTFNWKENKESSAGVIAQDVEKVFPEIIKSTGDIKTVNYNGLIGLLIESVKNQQEQINMLRKEIEDMKR